MKPFNFLLATGNNVAHALTTLKEQIDKDYANQACQIQQIFMMPEARQIQKSSIATPDAQPQVQYLVNLVAVIVEEPELDSLQRNYKPVFDHVNNNRETIIPILTTWLELITGNAIDNPKPFNE